MAALVWAAYPDAGHEQILNKLITSSNYFPGRSDNFGWGAINAEVAVR
jgi:serine protease